MCAISVLELEYSAMANEKSGVDGNGDAGSKVAFDYIKSQQFRVIHVDGALGGITPNGHVHIALYSERPAIPKRQVNLLNADGSLGEDIPDETVTRASIVREVEADILLTADVTEALHRWLGDRIVELQKRSAKMSQKGKKN